MKTAIIQSVDLIVAMDISIQLHKEGWTVWGITSNFAETEEKCHLLRPELIVCNLTPSQSLDTSKILERIGIPYHILGDEPYI